MKYQRKPATVEAAQVNQELTLTDGTVIGAGEWLVIHEDGRTTSVNDTDFASEYEPLPDPPTVVETPDEADAPAEEPAPVQ